jgi:hypothetical protein
MAATAVPPVAISARSQLRARVTKLTVEDVHQVGSELLRQLGVVLDGLERVLFAEQAEVQHRRIGEQVEGG